MPSSREPFKKPLPQGRLPIIQLYVLSKRLSETVLDTALDTVRIDVSSKPKDWDGFWLKWLTNASVSPLPVNQRVCHLSFLHVQHPRGDFAGLQELCETLQFISLKSMDVTFESCALNQMSGEWTRLQFPKVPCQQMTFHEDLNPSQISISWNHPIFLHYMARKLRPATPVGVGYTLPSIGIDLDLEGPPHLKLIRPNATDPIQAIEFFNNLTTVSVDLGLSRENMRHSVFRYLPPSVTDLSILNYTFTLGASLHLLHLIAHLTKLRIVHLDFTWQDGTGRDDVLGSLSAGLQELHITEHNGRLADPDIFTFPYCTGMKVYPSCGLAYPPARSQSIGLPAEQRYRA
jgi:hypothetical protein